MSLALLSSSETSPLLMSEGNVKPHELYELRDEYSRVR